MKRLRLIILIVTVTLLGSADSFAQMTTDEALSKFVAAGIAYQKEDYDTAIERYSEILKGGRESGAVYYNLGNSYFRSGQIGRAVLNYERAKRLIPRDSDLNFNDHYVHARIGRYGADQSEGWIAQTISSFIHFYTIEEMVLIVVGVIFGMAAVFLLSLYLGWPKSWSRGSIVVLSIILTVYVAGLMVKVEQSRDLAVSFSSTEAYFEPRMDSTVHFKLPEGAKVKVLRFQGDWAKIERLDRKSGWVVRDGLEKI